jgi:uncharacterized protein
LLRLSAPTLAPVELLVLQGTSFCSLNCTYCDLSAVSRRQRRVMPPELIDRIFSELFAFGRLAPDVAVIWHLGEPLTLPPEYYDDAIARILRQRDVSAPGRVNVRFEIQTNGVHIDEAWCAFFRRHATHLDLGVSCDGPPAMHDAFRLNWSGRATHARTWRGMDLLARHGIRYRVIAVVTERTLADPEGFLDFFHQRREHLAGFHFNILAAGSTGDSPELRYGPADRARYYQFYRRLLDLDRAAQQAGGGLSIQNFTQGLARVLAARSDRTISYAEEGSAPLRSLNVDALGNVTTFYAGLAPEAHRDHYGDGRGLCLGNILERPLEDMIRSPKLRAIMDDFARSRQACRRDCAYFDVCPGGFELTKLATYGRFDTSETPECVIHVQTLVDALLDDVAAHLAERESAPAT